MYLCSACACVLKTVLGDAAHVGSRHLSFGGSDESAPVDSNRLHNHEGKLFFLLFLHLLAIRTLGTTGVMGVTLHDIAYATTPMTPERRLMM